MAHPSTWLRVLPQGLYCEPGDFFIDPTRAVEGLLLVSIDYRVRATNQSGNMVYPFYFREGGGL